MRSAFRLTRRSALFGMGAAGLATACRSLPDTIEPLAEMETRAGGRIGVFARNLATGATLEHRADERFAMCSTFKALLASAMLFRADRGVLSMQVRMPVRQSDIVSWSPVTQNRVGEQMTVAELCAATMTISDNAAANILLREIGGPEGFTAQMRDWGDRTTRLDRWEPVLNENLPGDVRDTSTPRAMATTFRSLAFGGLLEPASAQQLMTWMIEAKTGLQRLRSRAPERWTTGDKTGTSSSNQSNDLAFFIPPDDQVNSGPVIIASYLNVPAPTAPETDALHAEIARLAFERLTTPRA